MCSIEHRQCGEAKRRTLFTSKGAFHYALCMRIVSTELNCIATPKMGRTDAVGDEFVVLLSFLCFIHFMDCEWGCVCVCVPGISNVRDVYDHTAPHTLNMHNHSHLLATNSIVTFHQFRAEAFLVHVLLLLRASKRRRLQCATRTGNRIHLHRSHRLGWFLRDEECAAAFRSPFSCY